MNIVRSVQCTCSANTPNPKPYSDRKGNETKDKKIKTR